MIPLRPEVFSKIAVILKTEHSRRDAQPNAMNKRAKTVHREFITELAADALREAHQTATLPRRQLAVGLHQITRQVKAQRLAGFFEGQQFGPPEPVMTAGFTQSFPFCCQRL